MTLRCVFCCRSRLVKHERCLHNLKYFWFPEDVVIKLEWINELYISMWVNFFLIIKKQIKSYPWIWIWTSTCDSSIEGCLRASALFEETSINVYKLGVRSLWLLWDSRKDFHLSSKGNRRKKKKNKIPFIRAPHSFIISATVLNIINSGGSTF